MGSLLSDMLESEFVSTDRVVARFRITKVELAKAAGLSRDAVSKRSRRLTVATQSRLREMLQIINRVRDWAGSDMAAYAWYRSQPIPSFGDRTAEDLVKEGKGEAVMRYLSRITVGGYA